MITDKNGKEVKLNDILDFLVGTDDDDMAKSVIDFAYIQSMKIRLLAPHISIWWQLRLSLHMYHSWGHLRCWSWISGMQTYY